MATVQTVEEATQLALSFVRRHYSFAVPVSTRKQNFHWIVDLDISYFRPSYARVTIHVETGTIEDYKVTPGQLL